MIFVFNLAFDFRRKTIFEKEDWKSVLDLVSNARHAVSSVQDAARKLVDYTNFGSQTKFVGELYLACRRSLYYLLETINKMTLTYVQVLVMLFTLIYV